LKNGCLKSSRELLTSYQITHYLESCDRESTLSFPPAIRNGSSIQASLAKSRNRIFFVAPLFLIKAQTKHEMETKKKPEMRTKSIEEAQKENEPGRYGVIGAINNNVGSNYDASKEAQTKQEMEQVERKGNRMETGERTEQPPKKRCWMEPPLAKERVLKEYESGGSGETYQSFRRKDSNSLPEQLIKERKENELPPQGAVRASFLGGRRKNRELSFNSEKQSIHKEPQKENEPAI